MTLEEQLAEQDRVAKLKSAVSRGATPAQRAPRWQELRKARYEAMLARRRSQTAERRADPVYGAAVREQNRHAYYRKHRPDIAHAPLKGGRNRNLSAEPGQRQLTAADFVEPIVPAKPVSLREVRPVIAD